MSGLEFSSRSLVLGTVLGGGLSLLDGCVTLNNIRVSRLHLLNTNKWISCSEVDYFTSFNNSAYIY